MAVLRLMTDTLGEFPQRSLRLLQPEPHAHLAVHRGRGGEVLPRLLAVARPPVEFAEAEVAVGSEGPHLQLFRQRQGAPVVLCTLLGIELLGMRGDVAEQMERLCLTRAIPPLQRQLAEPPSLCLPTDQQGGPSQPEGLNPART